MVASLAAQLVAPTFFAPAAQTRGAHTPAIQQIFTHCLQAANLRAASAVFTTYTSAMNKASTALACNSSMNIDFHNVFNSAQKGLRLLEGDEGMLLCNMYARYACGSVTPSAYLHAYLSSRLLPTPTGCGELQLLLIFINLQQEEVG